MSKLQSLEFSRFVWHGFDPTSGGGTAVLQSDCRLFGLFLFTLLFQSSSGPRSLIVSQVPESARNVVFSDHASLLRRPGRQRKATGPVPVTRKSEEASRMPPSCVNMSREGCGFTLPLTLQPRYFQLTEDYPDGNTELRKTRKEYDRTRSNDSVALGAADTRKNKQAKGIRFHLLLCLGST
ncbi:hypothetical protein BKA80DRAFT_260028 [Phyllosticta citrichinensis]